MDQFDDPPPLGGGLADAGLARDAQQRSAPSAKRPLRSRPKRRARALSAPVDGAPAGSSRISRRRARWCLPGMATRWRTLMKTRANRRSGARSTASSSRFVICSGSNPFWSDASDHRGVQYAGATQLRTGSCPHWISCRDRDAAVGLQRVAVGANDSLGDGSVADRPHSCRVGPLGGQQPGRNDC